MRPGSTGQGATPSLAASQVPVEGTAVNVMGGWPVGRTTTDAILSSGESMRRADEAGASASRLANRLTASAIDAKIAARMSHVIAARLVMRGVYPRKSRRSGDVLASAAGPTIAGWRGVADEKGGSYGRKSERGAGWVAGTRCRDLDRRD